MLNVEIVEEIHSICSKKHWTLAVAESCTGGMVSSEIVQRAGVSNFFLGSLVTYSIGAKHEVLGIDWNILNIDDAVSEACAVAMARGARLRLKSDWGLAITGYAGPEGGSVDKPVGTVCFAVIGATFEHSETRLFSGHRIDIQKAATHRALGLINEVLKKT